MDRPLHELGGDLEGAPPCCPLVSVHPDSACLALAAAVLVVQEARRSTMARGRFTVALAGGTTPERTYRMLAEPPFVDLVPWQSVHVFWGDERCVDPSDHLSNERMARLALLDRVPIPPEQLHPMNCRGGDIREEATADLDSEGVARRSAEEYENLLHTFFGPGEDADVAGCSDLRGQKSTGLDLAILGLGADGHTASLFPGSAAVQERKRWVMPVPVEGAGSTSGEVTGQDFWRITLTAPFLNKAASAVFLVSGSAKAAAVSDTLDGPRDSGCLPAQLIRPKTGAVRWLLDDDAARLLRAGVHRS